jgi:hypothetical protein
MYPRSIKLGEIQLSSNVQTWKISYFNLNCTSSPLHHICLKSQKITRNMLRINTMVINAFNSFNFISLE